MISFLICFNTDSCIGASVTGFIEDWRRCVKNLTVSSRENMAFRLTDGSNYCWQSFGKQGKVSFKSFFYYFKIFFSVIIYNQNSWHPKGLVSALAEGAYASDSRRKGEGSAKWRICLTLTFLMKIFHEACSIFFSLSQEQC